VPALSGFSLIELMVAVSITAIVLALAAPSFSDVVSKNRISSVVQDFFATTSYARSEAVKRGGMVCICKSPDGTSCGTGTATWTDGWIVFRNTDGDSPPVVDSGETILKVFSALTSGYTLSASSNLASHICYDRYGMANTTGNLVACHSSDETTAKAILVLRTRPRMATDSDGDGIPNVEAGGVLSANIDSCESP
jgi:type IV fimbrial biogenesis protein FimT